MNRSAVLLVNTRDDPVVLELAKRLKSSPQLSLHSGRPWSDRELESNIARGLRLECSLVVLMCSAARNETLWRALLSHDLSLIIVRIDLDVEPAGGVAQILRVDLVQQFELDRKRFGFDHLLSTFHYLVEHHGAGAVDQLNRFLVLADPASRDGPGVRFLQVDGADSLRTLERKLPPTAMKWLNAALRESVTQQPEDENGGMVVGRARALALLDMLESAPRRKPAEAMASAERELLQYLMRPEAQLEPLSILRRQLGLTLEEVQTLILCLGPEVDLAYQLVYGRVNDDMTRRYATAALVDAVRTGNSPSTAARAVSSLMALRILEGDGARIPAADQPLRVDAAVLQWLFVGGDALLTDPLPKSVTLADSWRGREFLTQPEDAAERGLLRDQLRQAHPETYWTVLTGADVEGWRALMELAVIDARTGIIRVSLERFAALDSAAREDCAIRIARAGRLMAWHTVIDCARERTDASALTTLVDAHSPHNGAGFVIAENASDVATSLPRGRWRTRERTAPSLPARIRHFAVALDGMGVEVERIRGGTPPDERLATSYPLNIDALNGAVALALAELKDDAGQDARVQALTTACRRIASSDVVSLVRRIEPVHRLKDVIVPADRHAILEEILSNVRYGNTVLQKWGFGAQFPQGQGIAALFAGPSGTGKTMAAQAIACELGVDVFSVDLSRVVSKYIGETEKHLERVFQAAEQRGGVLVFDEADALFGKRSEVKDAHDRYANVEVAFLLQRMELFSGLAILTSNSRQNLDPAFLRRLRFVVDFPRPNAKDRQTIWENGLPRGAPVEGKIDWPMLARFELSGGVIRQVTLRAAFIAAGAGREVIAMPDLLAALRSELEKLGMQSAERDLDEYVRLRTTVSREKAA
jgi:ATPase family associated with various cellular activities (AAA)